MEENEVEVTAQAAETAPAEEAVEAAEVQQPDFSRYEAHIADLQLQEQAMIQQFPEFSLARELQNPVFLQLTAPGTGISLEDAYYALHRKELQQSAAREVKEQVVSAIQAGARRPQEAGASSQGPSLLSFRYDAATKEQREAFKKELRRAWGRGETVYPR